MKKILIVIVLVCNISYSQTDCVDLNSYTTQYMEFVSNDDNSFPVGTSFLTSSGNGWINYIKLNNNDTYDSIVGNVLYFSGGIGIDVAGPLCSNRTLTFSSGNINELIVDQTVVFSQNNPQPQFNGTNFTVNWNGNETFEVTGEFQMISLFGSQNTLYDVCFICEGLGFDDQNLGFTLYPNPVIDKFSIHGCKEDALLEIMDISGQIVLQEKIIVGDNEINTSFLKAGVYNVRVSQDNTDATYLKIIKARF
jgi:hypothetical protein